MKLHYFLSAVAALFFTGHTLAEAQPIEPYTFDFNTQFSTSANDFSVGTGWAHLADAHEGSGWSSSTTYPSYSWAETDGVDGTGCLKVGTQENVGDDYDEDYGPTYDLIVTPAVSGTASIYVKKTSSYVTSSVKFYEVTENGGTLTSGNELEATFEGELTNTDFVKVTLSGLSSTRVGIRGSYVYLDNFEAESAEIALKRAMTVSTKTLTSSNAPDCAADGTFPVQATVSVTNSGDVDLAPGDEGYSLSLVFESTGEVLSTLPLDKPLAVGATETFELSAQVPYEGHKARSRYDIKENLSGTSYYLAWIEPTPYAPVMVLRGDNGRMETGEAVAYGMANESVTKTFSLENSGAAPLNVTEVSVPEGFTTSLTAPLTVEPKTQTEFTITLNAAEAGVWSGDFVVKGEGIDDFSLALSGTVLDPAKFYANFENNEMPAGVLYDESNWELTYWSETDNSRVLSSSTVEATKFILPLLEVAEGEKMTFAAGKRSYNSFVNVYTSPDRQTWTLLREITADEMPAETVGGYGSYDYQLGSFVLEGVPAGKQYIAFESGYANLDDIYGFTKVAVAHDWFIQQSVIPASATVNHPYTATVSLKNVNAQAEGTDYTATLYFDGEAVQTAEAVEMEAGAVKEFTFAFTPHESGTHEAYVSFAADDYTVSTTPVEVKVAAETAAKNVTAGTATGFNNNAPLNTYYKHSETETIYTADQLGLQEGDRITKLTFRGYGESDLDVNITAWMENTDAADYAVADTTVKDRLTQVFQGTYSFKAGGSESDPVDMLVLNLDEPFTYTGRNLRIVVRHDADNYKRIYYQVNAEDTQHAIGRQNDDDITAETVINALSQPVVTLGVAMEPNSVSGTVTDTHGFPVPHAAISLTSGEVRYDGQTDAEGRYTVSVVQADKTYAATVEATGFEGGSLAELTFAEGDLTEQNVTLTQIDPTYTVGVPALVCLPVDLDPEAAAQAGTFFELNGYEADRVSVSEAKAVTAGIPYLFVPAVEKPFVGVSNYEISAEALTVTMNGLNLVGTYATQLPADTEQAHHYGLGTATETETPLAAADRTLVLPFAAYFMLSEAPATLPVIELGTKLPTALEGVSTEAAADAPVYTIDGRRVAAPTATSKLPKGIYVIGGRKVLVK